MKRLSFFGFLLFGSLLFVSAVKPVYAAFYPGQTLDPGCSPATSTCTVTQLSVDSSTGNFGIGTTSPLSALTLSATSSLSNLSIFSVFAVPSIGATSSVFNILSTGYVGLGGTTTPGSVFSINNIANFTNATTTFVSTGGINVVNGCLAVNGTCVGAAGGSGTVGASTEIGQTSYYAAVGTTLSATSTLTIATTTFVGIGTVLPVAKLEVNGDFFFSSTTSSGARRLSVATTTSGTTPLDLIIANANGFSTATNGSATGGTTIVSGGHGGVGTGNAGATGGTLNLLGGAGASVGSAAGAGGPVVITGGAANGNGGAAGGALTFTGGAGAGTTGSGGALTFTGGAGAGTAAGGVISLTAGANASSPTGAAVTIQAASGGTTGGAVNITSGAVVGSGTGGAVNITAGTVSSNGAGGAVVVTGGAGGGSGGVGGAITLSAGNAAGASAVGGVASLFAGNGGSGAIGGAVKVYGGTGNVTGNKAGGDAYLYGGLGGGSGLAGNVLLAFDGANSFGKIGIGTTSPTAILSIMASSSLSNIPLIMVATSSATATSTVFTISSNGYVGIGTSTPGMPLSVQGRVIMDGLTASGAVQTSFICGTTASGGEIIADSASCSVSALKFKRDVVNLDVGLEELLQMNPVSYFKKEPLGPEDSKRQMGFIADEVANIPKLKEMLVTYDSSGDVHGFRYEQFTALLAKSIQQQELKINDLKNLVTSSNSSGISFSSVLTSLETLGTKIVDSIVYVKNLIADQVITKKLCLEDVCVTKTELQALLQNANVQSVAQDALPNLNNTTISPPITPDTEAPVITITGSNPSNITKDVTYIDMGATVTDNVDHNLGITVIGDQIDTSVIGTSTVTYTAMDQAGNTATTTRTVIVSN